MGPPTGPKTGPGGRMGIIGGGPGRPGCPHTMWVFKVAKAKANRKVDISFRLLMVISLDGCGGMNRL